MEQLRFLAGTSGGKQSELVQHTAFALASMSTDRSMVLVACRRVLERHWDVAPLWWLCSRVLLGGDPHSSAMDAMAELAADATDDWLRDGLAAGRRVAVRAGSLSAGVLGACRADGEIANSSDRGGGFDLVVVDAIAASSSEVLVGIEDAQTLATAGTDAALVCRVGVRVPEAVIAQMCEAAQPDRDFGIATASGPRSITAVDPQRFCWVVSTTGWSSASAGESWRADAAVAPELLGRAR